MFAYLEIWKGSLFILFFSLPRVFVATWNVGGKSPHYNLNLDDFLQVHNQSDIYVLGYVLSIFLIFVRLLCNDFQPKKLLCFVL